MEAEQFRRWREGTGYTQAAAAARFFKVTRTTLQNWESGATPVPAAVETACKIWERRVRQENAAYGPVVLVYGTPEGPCQEQFKTNSQAIARVCELSRDISLPCVMATDGTPLWDVPELQRIIWNEDPEAPTYVNLLRRCANAVQALANDARRPDSPVWTGEPTAAAKVEQLRCIAALADELQELATGVERGENTSSLPIEERLKQLRNLGKRPSEVLFNGLAQAFVALQTLPQPSVKSPVDIKVFADHCVFMQSIYLHALILFEISDAKEKDRLGRVAPVLFGDLSRMFGEYMILQVCKITDPPADIRKNENHTVSFLLQHYVSSFDPKASEKLAETNARLQIFRTKLLPARNKFIAHAGRAAVLAGHPLGAAPQSDWDNFWEDLEALVCIIHEKVVGTPFKITEVAGLSDADSLLQALWHGDCFNQLMRGSDRAIARKCTDLALGSA